MFKHSSSRVFYVYGSSPIVIFSYLITRVYKVLSITN